MVLMLILLSSDWVIDVKRCDLVFLEDCGFGIKG